MPSRGLACWQTIRFTEHAGHAHEIASEAAASGVELVIAWGGDGTINEVGRALVQAAGQRRRDVTRGTALGIIPGGSGNGLARELRIPFDPAQAIERAMTAQVRDVDAGELGGRVFFNIAGIGLDAHVAALVSMGIKYRGLVPYMKATFRDLLRYVPLDYTVTTDGNTLQDICALAGAGKLQTVRIRRGDRSDGQPGRRLARSRDR